MTIGDAIDYAMDGASSIIGGWSAYDVYAPQDLEPIGKTVLELINDKER